ncbi:MAG: serine/threonine protein kinase [Myxococcales bacterium]|nr:serine/threonine protein kinase [Myxococcales bacterium]
MNTATERVGRYQLLEPIGTGPCGSVSRAKVFGVAGFERQFAVKRFHPELTITTALAQGLSAAARSYGSLEHPRIARMSEFGVAQGQTFTAVEFVVGLDAARLVAEARLANVTLAAGGALALISQAARAVGYAHGRGLTHLGLAPTNVIVTADGDVKITDFAILAAGLPQRPIDVARLQHRIQYLAPEQVANEATSAATDVFALGVIAYELVTGQRTFRGETPQQVAQAIMAGPPAEPPLPRPIVRVLQRCLARSPFERFPDARALADALDAALRVAPVPGTRKDIGAQVKSTQDRLAALNDSEMSGMVALNVGTGPIRREPAQEIATLGREAQLDVPTREFVRPDVPVPGPARLVGPSTKAPELIKPASTVQGVPPPPIPMPPGVASGLASGKPGAPGGASTLLGIATAKVAGAIPAFGRAQTPPPVPPSRVSEPRVAQPRPGTEPVDMDMLIGPDSAAFDAPTEAGYSATMPGMGEAASSRKKEPTAPTPYQRGTETSEMSPLLADMLNTASTRETREVEPLVAEAFHKEALNEFPDEQHSSPNRPALSLPTDESPPPAASAAETTSRRSSPSVRSTTPPPPPLDETDSEPGNQDYAMPPGITDESVRPVPHLPAAPARSSNPAVIVALGVLGLGGLAFAGWQVYDAMKKDEATTQVAAVPTRPAVRADAGVVATPVDAAAVATPVDAVATAISTDAAKVAAVADAGTLPADAAPVTRPDPMPTGSSDALTITSTPPGARVYLDGAETGVTPLKLPASADRHTVALLLPGHELYIAAVDGAGAFAIPMKEVTPSGGPAGIKVLKCKDKDRYYVFVDGKPTGQLCPTERIETDVGPHTVEIYDAVTETRKKFDIVVKDTRLSHRVKVE